MMIMTKKKNIRFILVGLLAGGLNGLLGAGGGPLLVPMFVSFCGLEEKKALATSLAVMAVLCAVSAGTRFVCGQRLALEYVWLLIGGAVGGAVGGMALKRISSAVLMRIFGGIMLVSGIRTVFF